jgi:hypothetical protein
VALIALDEESGELLPSNTSLKEPIHFQYKGIVWKGDFGRVECVESYI